MTTKPYSSLTDLGHAPRAGVSKALGERILRVVKSADPAPSEIYELMELARVQGAASTAEALRARLDAALAKRGKVTGKTPGKAPGAVGLAPAAVATASLELGDSSSPIDGVDDAAWAKFSSALSKDRALSNEERGGRLGMYAVSMKRLADLNIVENPQKIRVSVERGPKGEPAKVQDTWTADWNKISREAFLGSPRAQHQVLRKSMADYAEKIHESMAAAIGKKVSKDGAAVTLSGLLGVAHVAGLRGLESWLRNPEERKKFPNTTRVFAETNGVF